MLKFAQSFTRRRLKGPESEPIVISRKRIYIMPNRLGMIFSIVVFTMLFGSINYDNSLGYALSFLLIGIGFISILHTHSNLAHLRIECGSAKSVHAGSFSIFKLNLGSNRDQKFNIKIENAHSKDNVDISFKDKSRVKLKLPSTKRGYLAIGKFKVSTDYPFGIITAWSWVELDFNSLIYPLAEDEKVAVEMSSSHKTSIANLDQSRNDDFMGFRNYQNGDSPKQLYWKYFPANDLLLTKQFAGGGEDDIWLNWETVAHLPIEIAISRLCRWVLICGQSQNKYGLILGSNSIKPNNGEAHKHECLRQLALFKS